MATTTTAITPTTSSNETHRLQKLCDILTPSIVLPSYLGHLLYTPRDLEKDVFLQPPPPQELEQDNDKHSSSSSNHDPRKKLFLLFDIGDILQKDFQQRSLHELSTVNEDFVRIFSYWGIHGPPVNCEGQSLSINTNAGRKKLSLSDYITKIQIEKPPIIISLADEVGLVGNNRIKKAINRTWSWFKELKEKDLGYQPYLFGVLVVDHSYPDQAKNMVESLASSGVNGLVLGGAHPHLPLGQRKQLVQHIRNQKSDLLIVTQGADSFQLILEDLEIGIDLIHSNYPLILTKKGCAINFQESSLVEAEEEEEGGDGTNIPIIGKRKRDENENEPNNTVKRQKRSRKEMKREEEKEEPPQIDYEKKAIPFDSYSINLWEERFEKDISPLFAGCHCHACRYHTKAYVHHLLKSNELTADILLYQHNQFQLLRLFEEARAAIGKNSFALWKNKFQKSHA